VKAHTGNDLFKYHQIPTECRRIRTCMPGGLREREREREMLHGCHGEVPGGLRERGDAPWLPWRAARRFTGKGRCSMAAMESCQEVYGNFKGRCSMAAMESCQEVDGKGRCSMAAMESCQEVYGEREMLHDCHGEAPWLPWRGATRLTRLQNSSKCRRPISVGARLGDNVKMVEKIFTSENVL
jgi:hypothetical protein